MLTCGKCKSGETDSYGLAKCDFCKILKCVSCSGISASEHKGITVKKRSPCITYKCLECLESCTPNVSSDPNYITAFKNLLDKGFKDIKDFIRNENSTGELSRLLEDTNGSVSSMISEQVTLSSKIDDLSNSINAKVSCTTTQSASMSSASCSPNDFQQLKKAFENLKNMFEEQQAEILALKRGISRTNAHSTPPNTKENIPSSKTQLQPEKSNRNHPLVGTKKSEEGLVAARHTPKISIFISKVSKDVSGETVIEYLKNNFGSEKHFHVEGVTVKSGDYNAFKIDADKELEELLLNPQYWPEDIRIQKYQSFRPRRPAYGLGNHPNAHNRNVSIPGKSNHSQRERR